MLFLAHQLGHTAGLALVTGDGGGPGPSGAYGLGRRRGLVPDAPEYIVALPEVRERVPAPLASAQLSAAFAQTMGLAFVHAVAPVLAGAFAAVEEAISTEASAAGTKRFDWDTAMPYYQEMAEVMAEQGDVRLLKALRAHKRGRALTMERPQA